MGSGRGVLGHDRLRQVSDSVLQEVGPRLRAAFRSEDLVARLGGDEFAVFMPGADSDAAQAPSGGFRTRSTDRSSSTASTSSLMPASGSPGTPITEATSTPCSSGRTSRCTGPRQATTRS
jgi:GGDEF domain-containing protein